MSLKLTLSSGERLFIGTTSLVVASDATVTIIIDGDLPVLREKDVLAEGESTGEAARFYLALQTMYLTGEVAQHLVECRAHAEALRQSVPGSGPLLAEIEAEMHSGSIYRALKVARRLLEMEKEPGGWPRKGDAQETVPDLSEPPASSSSSPFRSHSEAVAPPLCRAERHR